MKNGCINGAPESRYEEKGLLRESLTTEVIDAGRSAMAWCMDLLLQSAG